MCCTWFEHAGTEWGDGLYWAQASFLLHLSFKWIMLRVSICKWSECDNGADGMIACLCTVPPPISFQMQPLCNLYEKGSSHCQVFLLQNITGEVRRLNKWLRSAIYLWISEVTRDPSLLGRGTGRDGTGQHSWSTECEWESKEWMFLWGHKFSCFSLTQRQVC